MLLPILHVREVQCMYAVAIVTGPTTGSGTSADPHGPRIVGQVDWDAPTAAQARRRHPGPERARRFKQVQLFAPASRTQRAGATGTDSSGDRKQGLQCAAGVRNDGTSRIRAAAAATASGASSVAESVVLRIDHKRRDFVDAARLVRMSTGQRRRPAAHRAKLWSMQPPLSLGARLPQENIVWSVCFGSGTAGFFGSATPNAVVFSSAPNASLLSGWSFAFARFALHTLHGQHTTFPSHMYSFVWSDDAAVCCPHGSVTTG